MRSVQVAHAFYGRFEARHAHNEIVQQLFAYGAAVVCLLSATYTLIFRAIRRLPQSSMRVLLGGFLLFVLVRGFADTEVFDISWPMWLLVLFGPFVAEQQTQEVMA